MSVCAWVEALGHGDATDATLPLPSAPMVKYMLDAMKQKGCKLPHDFIAGGLTAPQGACIAQVEILGAEERPGEEHAERDQEALRGSMYVM